MEKGRGRKHVILSPHAKDKVARLRHLGVSEELVHSILMKPQKIEAGFLNRKIAQGALNQTHLIRVVFEEINNTMLVITVYPAGRRRYMK